jgi:hypothetical protein
MSISGVQHDFGGRGGGGKQNTFYFYFCNTSFVLKYQKKSRKYSFFNPSNDHGYSLQANSVTRPVKGPVKNQHNG